MLTDEQWRFALEDARTRHEAVIGLMYAVDQQATSILSLCVTLDLATASGAIAALSKDSIIPAIFVIPLIIATITFAIAAWFCFIALTPAIINMPGRDPNFWLWANGDEPANAAEVYTSYLNDLAEQRKKNNAVNKGAAVALARAKTLCVAAPLLMLIAAGVIELFR